MHCAFVDGGDDGDGFLMRSDGMGVEPGGEILQSYRPEKSNPALWQDFEVLTMNVS